jgi:hypothetical protein
VSYTLAEYMSILRAHLGFIMRHRPKAKRLRQTWMPFTMDLWIAVFAPPIFFLKKRRMPVCEFRIDGHGIERTSRLGTLAKSWDEVKMVRRYRSGYLLMYAQGGMPIPFRCLDQRQQEQLRAYTTGRGLADSAA